MSSSERGLSEAEVRAADTFVTEALAVLSKSAISTPAIVAAMFALASALVMRDLAEHPEPARADVYLFAVRQLTDQVVLASAGTMGPAH